MQQEQSAGALRNSCSVGLPGPGLTTLMTNTRRPFISTSRLSSPCTPWALGLKGPPILDTKRTHVGSRTKGNYWLDWG